MNISVNHCAGTAVGMSLWLLQTLTAASSVVAGLEHNYTTVPHVVGKCMSAIFSDSVQLLYMCNHILKKKLFLQKYNIHRPRLGANSYNLCMK